MRSIWTEEATTKDKLVFFLWVTVEVAVLAESINRIRKTRTEIKEIKAETVRLEKILEGYQHAQALQDYEDYDEDDWGPEDPEDEDPGELPDEHSTLRLAAIQDEKLGYPEAVDNEGLKYTDQDDTVTFKPDFAEYEQSRHSWNERMRDR